MVGHVVVVLDFDRHEVREITYEELAELLSEQESRGVKFSYSDAPENSPEADS